MPGALYLLQSEDGGSGSSICLPRFKRWLKPPFIECPSGRDRERQVAFYGGSFTAIPKEDQSAYLRDVQPFLSSRADRFDPCFDTTGCPG